jgi:hypothetical protein
VSEPLRVCWVDSQWDRANASDRVSRYGAYLRNHTELFDPWHEAPNGITQDPGEFARRGVSGGVRADHEPRLRPLALQGAGPPGGLRRGP